MAGPLVTLAEVKAAGAPNGNDAALTRAIDAASLTLERETGCALYASTAADQIHSGDLAWLCRDESGVYGSRLFLQDHATGFYTRPVIAITGVTENGTALTVVRVPSSGPWTDTANGVLILDREGVAVRCSVSDGVPRPQPWKSGVANIRVTGVSGGFADGAAPEDIKQACIELALLYYREGLRIGVETMNDLGSSVSYSRTLTPKTRDVIAFYSRRWSPVTLAG